MKSIYLLSFSFILVFVSPAPFRGFNFLKSYQSYELAIANCDCLDGQSPQSKVRELENQLNHIQSELEPYLANSFLAVFLSAKIIQTKVQIADIKYQSGIIGLTQYKFVVEKLIELSLKYSDYAQAFEFLKKDKPNKAALACLGMNSIDIQEFEEKAWQQFKIQSDEIIYNSEEFIFLQMVPVLSAKNLVDFISQSPYKKKPLGRNYKTDEAFQFYYKLITQDGEPSTIKQFDGHIRNNKGTDLWISLLENSDFQTYMNEDLAHANEWCDLLTSSISTPEDYQKIIEQAAPREIAFVALQKLIRPLLEDHKYYQAWQTAQSYTKNFVDQTPYSNMDQKFRRFIKLLQKMYLMSISEGKQFHIDNVREISDEEAIWIMTNRTHNRLAILPKTKGEINSNRINKYGQLTRDRTFYCDPYMKIYGFVEDRRFQDSVREYNRITDFHLDAINGIKTSSDFFISYEYKVAFFVSLSESERRDTLSGFSEYMSPGLVNTPDGYFFQEYGRTGKFHGKEHGNLNTDIFYSVYHNGRWREPHLLRNSNGNSISVNTAFSERCPVLSLDGRYLYFSSEGHEGFGGFDVFRVPIKINGTIVEVTDSPQNISDVNSWADDLFFTPVNDTLAFLSSNRNSDRFQLHRAIIMNRQADPPPPPVDENILVPINSELTLQADCIEMPRPDPALNGRNIRIVGRIFDKNRQLLQKAKIAFIPNNQIGVADTVDLSTGDSTYQVLLNTNSREIVIEVLGIDVNTDSIVSKFTTFLDSLCDNRSRRRFIKQDHITEPWMSFIQNKEPAFLPFFFETDVSERFLNHEMQSNTYYKFIFQNASKNTAKFIFVGYADERGNSQHNDALSRNRAITIRNHFAFALGYLEKRMKSFGAGETTKFNNDDWKKYSYYVPDNLRKIYGAGKEKLWFQNRRVLVYFDY